MFHRQNYLPDVNDGGVQVSIPKKSNQRCSVIDDTGEACLGTIFPTKPVDFICKVLVTSLKVTSIIPRCMNGTKCRDRIAQEGETVWFVWNGENENVWMKTDSRYDSRDSILHRLPRSCVMEHGEDQETSVLEVRVQQLGEFSPKKSRGKCFLVPFGLIRDKREPTGVWVSAKYYREVMVPHIVSLGHSAEECEAVLGQLERCMQSDEECEEGEEGSEQGKTPEMLFQSQIPEVWQQQPYFQQVLVVPVLFPQEVLVDILIRPLIQSQGQDLSTPFCYSVQFPPELQ